MSQASATLSHRRSEGPRRRSIVPVTLLIVLAIVAQACGSSDSSNTSPVGAQENVATSADWNFQLLTPDGMALPIWPADDGTEVNGYLIGKDNQLRATVPAEVLASATDIVVEERTPTGDWTDTGLTLRVVDATGTPMQLPVDASGTAEATFNGGGAFLGPHEFRLRAQAGSADAVVGYSNVVQATGFETEPVAVVETSGEWSFEMQNMDGTPLDQYTTAAGVTLDKLVVYEGYSLTATVPVELLTPNNIFVVQYQLDSGDWITDRIIDVAADGSASGTYVPRQFWPEHTLRLAAVDFNRAPEMVPVASSNEIRVFQSYEYSIEIWNTTSNDLTIKIPQEYDRTSKTWAFVEFGVGIGETNTINYINTPATGFSLVLNKQKCFLDCTDYFMDWSWAPTDTGRTPCSDSDLHFTSGRTYTIKLSDNVDGQNDGWKTGIISSTAGPGTADVNCTFTTRTRAGEWLANHPVKGALVILGAVAILVAGVIVAGILIADAAATAAAVEAEDAALQARLEAQGQERLEKDAAEWMANYSDGVQYAVEEAYDEMIKGGATREEALIEIEDRFGEIIKVLAEWGY